MNDFLIGLISNWAYLFLFLIIVMLFFYYLFIKIIKIKKKGKWWLDFGVLLFAAFGVITISSDVRSWLIQNRLFYKEEGAKAIYRTIRSAIIPPPGFICREFIKTEYSPNNLIEIQREYNLACNWYKKAATNLPEKIDPEYPSIKKDLFPAQEFTDKILMNNFRELSQLFDEYESSRHYIVKNRQGKDKDEFESSIFVLSPLLLCIALALGFVKLFSEIKK